MEIKLGDLVVVEEKDAYVPNDPWTHPVQLGMLLTRLQWEHQYSEDSPFHGEVVHIKKTKWFGLVKLKEPVYTIELDVHSCFDKYIWTTKPVLKNKPSS